MSDGTGAMQEFGAIDRATPGAGSAGLLLLFAENHQGLPSGFPIGGSDVVVGRDEPADIRIPVNAISRQHARIRSMGGAFSVEDLDSTNGTFLDGRRIKSAILEENQELRMGDAILKFVPNNFTAFARYLIDGRVAVGGTRLGPTNGHLVGGFVIDRMSAELAKVAKSPLSVMILGESGTGKEVAARQLHMLSERAGRFCGVNCAAIPANLIESELFGYKKGAFSGADRDKPGLIKSADGGTLLLDEIGDMPAAAQAKLLRVLQSREVFPVGATQPETVDVRVICATHRDLGRLQAEDKFRPDLFARLNEYQVRLPPLRERKEDIYLLLKTFLARHGRPEIEPTFRAMTALLHHDWPYNVRELEACAKRCIALAPGNELSVDLLPDAVRECMQDYGRAFVAPSPEQAGVASRTPTRDELATLLSMHGGNVAAVGRELGKARMQVHRWIKRHELSLDDYR